MTFWSVALISLVIGLFLVIGGALVVYMGSLVKSAYEIKVEIQSDLEAGLKKIEEETEKKIRWIKRDVVEEVDKIKSGMASDNQRRLAELTENLGSRVAALEAAQKQGQPEFSKALEALRQDIISLDQRTKAMRREQKPAEAPTAPTAAAPTPAATPPPTEPPAVEEASPT